MEPSEVAVAITRDFFTVYFAQGVTLLGLVYLIFSGSIKKLINRFLVFTKLKVKAGPVVVEADGVSLGHTERTGDCKIQCARCVGVAETIKKNSNDVVILKDDVSKIAEHLDEVWDDQLEIFFHSLNIPLPRRIYAGLRHVHWKGNGDFKLEVIEECIKNPVVYNTILITKPEFKISEVEAALHGRSNSAFGNT